MILHVKICKKRKDKEKYINKTKKKVKEKQLKNKDEMNRNK